MAAQLLLFRGKLGAQLVDEAVQVLLTPADLGQEHPRGRARVELQRLMEKT